MIMMIMRRSRMRRIMMLMLMMMIKPNRLDLLKDEPTTENVNKSRKNQWTSYKIKHKRP